MQIPKAPRVMGSVTSSAVEDKVILVCVNHGTIKNFSGVSVVRTLSMLRDVFEDTLLLFSRPSFCCVGAAGSPSAVY